jgi:hypothetical protein
MSEKVSFVSTFLFILSFAASFQILILFMGDKESKGITSKV